MAETGQNIEGLTVPDTSFQVILEKDGFPHDVTELLMNRVNIVDSADYQENLTYMNEITLELNNEEGTLMNKNKTGVLDVNGDKVIECHIYCLNEATGDRAIKKFGGWLDCTKIKPDAVKLKVSVPAYSYFGKLERLSGLNLVSQYFDSNGLILYNTGLFVTRANIPGKILTNGLHTIYYKEGRAKLDNGAWTDLDYPNPTILSNKGETEQVEIGSVLSSIVQEGETNIIVKNEGEQYPYTFYYFGSATDIVKKCFEVLGGTGMEVDDFEISSSDGRRVLSWMPGFPGQNYFGSINSIVSNGTDRIFISLETTEDFGSNFAYEIWEINLTTKVFSKRYTTTETYYDKDNRHLLELSPDGSRLFAFFDSPGTEAFVQKFKTDTWERTAYTIDANRFEWSFVHVLSAKTLLLCALDNDTGNKHVYKFTADDIDADEMTAIYSDNSISHDSFQHLFIDKDGEIYFYFLEETGVSEWQIRRLHLTGGAWVYEEVAELPAGTTGQSLRGYDYRSEDRVLITSYQENKAHMIHHVNKTVTGNICPDGWRLASGFEDPDGDNKNIYVICETTDADPVERLGYYWQDTFTFADAPPEDINLILGIDNRRKQRRFCSTVDDSGKPIMLLSAYYPGVLMRYADTFVPTIFGEYNTASKNLRQVLQEIANNYLAFVRVDVNKKGYFIRRADYKTDKSLKLKPDYIKSNVTETLYSQTYDYVEINTGSETESFGDKGVDKKGLSKRLDLIPDELAKDFARHFYNYYAKERKLISFKYLPTFYDYEALDKVDLVELGMTGTGRIQSISPTEIDISVKVIYEETTGTPNEIDTGE